MYYFGTRWKKKGFENGIIFFCQTYSKKICFGFDTLDHLLSKNLSSLYNSRNRDWAGFVYKERTSRDPPSPPVEVSWRTYGTTESIIDNITSYFSSARKTSFLRYLSNFCEKVGRNDLFIGLWGNSFAT